MGPEARRVVQPCSTVCHGLHLRLRLLGCPRGGGVAVLTDELHRLDEERLLPLCEARVSEDRFDHVHSVVLARWWDPAGSPVEPPPGRPKRICQLVEPFRGRWADETALDAREVRGAHADGRLELMERQTSSSAPVLQHVTEGLGRAHRCITCRRIPPELAAGCSRRSLSACAIAEPFMIGYGRNLICYGCPLVEPTAGQKQERRTGRSTSEAAPGAALPAPGAKHLNGPPPDAPRAYQHSRARPAPKQALRRLPGHQAPRRLLHRPPRPAHQPLQGLPPARDPRQQPPPHHRPATADRRPPRRVPRPARRRACAVPGRRGGWLACSVTPGHPCPLAATARPTRHRL